MVNAQFFKSLVATVFLVIVKAGRFVNDNASGKISVMAFIFCENIRNEVSNSLFAEVDLPVNF